MTGATAWFTSRRRVCESPLGDAGALFRTNVRGTRTSLRWLGIERVVHMSTDEVLDRHNERPADRAPFRPGTPMLRARWRLSR